MIKKIKRYFGRIAFIRISIITTAKREPTMIITSVEMPSSAKLSMANCKTLGPVDVGIEIWSMFL
jgi:hypothetical protein